MTIPPHPDQVRAARELLGLSTDADRRAIVAAWKSALRLTHPDVAPERTRDMALTLSQRVNEAKTVLMADLELNAPPPPLIPDWLSMPVHPDGATTNGDDGQPVADADAAGQDEVAATTAPAPPRVNGESHSAPWRPPATPADRGPRRSEWAMDWTARVAPVSPSDPAPPRLTRRRSPRTKHPVRAWIAAAVVGVAAIVGVVWASAGADPGAAPSASGTTAAPPPTTAPLTGSLADAVRTGTVAPAREGAPAPTPEDGARTLVQAVATRDSAQLAGVLAPRVVSAQAAEILAALEAASRQPDALARAASGVSCEPLASPDAAACAFAQPVGILPGNLRFRRAGGGPWRLVGWAA